LPENLPYNENDLLVQVSQGNEHAFRQLYDKYRNKIYSLGMHLTRSEILSEEIVQDVFMKVWEKRDQLQDINYLNAWLRTVARNTCSNYLRNLAMEKLVMNRYALQNNSEMPSPENDLTAKEYEQIIEAAIRQLPPQQKKVYLLSRQGGKKQEEIANELNISIYTVKEYMKLAQRSIRQYLESNLDIAILLAMVIFLK
jgi:RNA polymerase sigma-70 factor (ECF subfamily)